MSLSCHCLVTVLSLSPSARFARAPTLWFLHHLCRRLPLFLFAPRGSLEYISMSSNEPRWAFKKLVNCWGMEMLRGPQGRTPPARPAARRLLLPGLRPVPNHVPTFLLPILLLCSYPFSYSLTVSYPLAPLAAPSPMILVRIPFTIL